MKHQEKLSKMGKSLSKKLTGLLLAVLVGCLAFILLKCILPQRFRWYTLQPFQP